MLFWEAHGGAGAGSAGGEGAGVDAGLHDEKVEDGAANGGEGADGFFVVGVGGDGASDFDNGDGFGDGDRGGDGGGDEFEFGGDDEAGFEDDGFPSGLGEAGRFDGEVVDAGGQEDDAVAAGGVGRGLAFIAGGGGVSAEFNSADGAAILGADVAFEDTVEGLALGEEEGGQNKFVHITLIYGTLPLQ